MPFLLRPASRMKKSTSRTHTQKSACEHPGTYRVLILINNNMKRRWRGNPFLSYILNSVGPTATCHYWNERNE
jgi:hypothetical protein